MSADTSSERRMQASKRAGRPCTRCRKESREAPAPWYDSLPTSSLSNSATTFTTLPPLPPSVLLR